MGMTMDDEIKRWTAKRKSRVFKKGDWCVIGLIGLITGHNGPGGSGQLCGERSRNDVVGFARA